MKRIPPLLRECLALPNRHAQDWTRAQLTGRGYDVHTYARFVYGPGTVPVMLVAHTDTVHGGGAEDLYLDKTRSTLWCPDGLGADDRAGLWAILSVLDSGARPHVLITDEEETGCHGAEDAALLLDCPADVRCLIQLDRMNANDAVYYGCGSRRLRRWVRSFGWQEAQGSYTDISVLAPAWGRAAVNLSVGYYGQHTRAEYLRLDQLATTLRRVRRMLAQPPGKILPYDGRTPARKPGGNRYSRIDPWPESFHGGKSLEDYLPAHYRDNEVAAEDDTKLELERECQGCGTTYCPDDLTWTTAYGWLCADCFGWHCEQVEKERARALPYNDGPVS